MRRDLEPSSSLSRGYPLPQGAQTGKVPSQGAGVSCPHPLGAVQNKPCPQGMAPQKASRLRKLARLAPASEMGGHLLALPSGRSTTVQQPVWALQPLAGFLPAPFPSVQGALLS